MPANIARAENHEAVLFTSVIDRACYLADYVRRGAEAGEEIYVVARAPHWELAQTMLASHEISVQAMIDSGQLRFWDATKAVDLFLEAGLPAFSRLQEFGENIDQPEIRARFPRLRFYGEGVDVLLSRGQTAAMMELEKYWDEFTGRRPYLQMVCSYSADTLRNQSAGFRGIAETHDALQVRSAGIPEKRELDAILEIEAQLRRAGSEEERKRLQEDAERMKLELLHKSRSATFSELRFDLMHEINNPLALLRLAIDRIQERVGGDPLLSEELLRANAGLDRIDEVSQKIARLVRGGDSNFSAVSLEEVFRKAAESHDSGPLDIEWVFSGESGNVHGDYTELSALADELLRNAIDAIRDSGKNSGKVRVSFEPSLGILLKVSVTDSGPGFPDAIRERAFEPFVSSKPDRKGMGLTQARSIVKRHNGEIRVSPTHGGIEMFFPLHK